MREERIHCARCGWKGVGYGGDPCPHCGSTERAASGAIAYVAQPNGYGCAIACVAMIVGKTYDEMEVWLVEQGVSQKRLEQGLSDHVWREALVVLGYSHVQRFECNAFTNQCDRAPWPPAPFAPVHIACVEVATGMTGSHAVVMLADGSVLDPAGRHRTTLAHPEYRRVSQVVGIWRRP